MTERRWAVFLRAMNVGGRRLTNDELVAAVEGLGLTDVLAYRASGNLLATSALDASALTVLLEDGLQAALGYPVPTVLRSVDQIEALGAARPFDDEPKPQVALVRTPPDAAVRQAALEVATIDDRLAFVDGDLFWSPRLGVGRSKLDVRGLERALGTFTVRTVGTLMALAKKVRK